jgi:hypothetical protein
MLENSTNNDHFDYDLISLGATFSNLSTDIITPNTQKLGLVANNSFAPSEILSASLQADPGNSITEAKDLGLVTGSKQANDWVGSTDGQDYYHFRTDRLGDLDYHLTGLSNNANIQLLNIGGGTISGSYKSGSQSEDKTYNNLAPGDYYFKVYGGDTNYNLAFELSNSDPGNSILDAKDLGLVTGSKQESGWIGSTDTSDYYRFRTDRLADLDYSLTGLSDNANVQLLNSNGSIVSGSYKSGSQSEGYSHSKLAAGDYYLKIYGKDTNYNLAFGLGSQSAITVTSPNGGNQLEAGKSYNFTWTDNISENVRLNLYQGGSFKQTINSNTPSDGSHYWTLPANLAPGSNYRIKIASVSNSNVDDWSDSEFTVQPKPQITVTSPNGGNQLEAGKTHNFTWTDNISENVRLDLYQENTLKQTISSNTPSDGSYNWTLPANLTTASNYKLKVSSVSNINVADWSNNYFTINPKPQITLTSPDGGNQLKSGENLSITWTDNISENVNIDLYRDDIFVQSIAGNTASDGQSLWTVPTGLPISDRYKIKVSKSGDSSIGDLSDSYFSVVENFKPIPDPLNLIEDGVDIVQGSTWNTKGTGDFNGDNIDDLIWQRQDNGETHLWLMNQNGERQSDVNFGSNLGGDIKGTGDFNGDNIDDLIWQRQDNGETHLWLMNQNGERQSDVNLGSNLGWDIKGTGDFNGDNIDDILWRLGKDDETHAWLLNKNGQRQTYVNYAANPNWDIKGTGDFNGDGITDILWQRRDNAETHSWLLDKNAQRRTHVNYGLQPGWDIKKTGDFNEDGTTDILWQEKNNGEIHAWLLNRNGERSNSVNFGQIPLNWDLKEAGDFNGDGTPDMLWRDQLGQAKQVHAWLLKDSKPGNYHLDDLIEDEVDIVQGSNWNTKGTGDFNGDNIDDLIWQRQDTGETHLWLMNYNGERQSHVNFGSNLGWDIKGTGDFNGDNIDDLIWQRQDTGETHLWLMNYNGERQSHVNFGSNLGWDIKGTGDFNGDNIDDILWRLGKDDETHAWLLNKNGQRQTYVNYGANPNWDIKGTGDFNGDGITDILWQRRDNAETHSWLLDKNGQRRTHVNYGLHPGWDIKETGDFNEDGTTDILWRSKDNDVVHAWLLNGDGNYASSVNFGRVSSDWNIKEAGDFDGDGTADILWQHNDGKAHISLFKDRAIYEPTDESQVWRSSVYHWSPTQGSQPPQNFFVDNNKLIGTVGLGSNIRSDGKFGINVNWQDGAIKGDSRLPHDNFAIRAYTHKLLEAGKTYKATVTGDDGFQLFAKQWHTNNIVDLLSNRRQGPTGWTQNYPSQGAKTYEFTVDNSGWYDLAFQMYEGHSASNFDFKLEDVTSGGGGSYYPELGNLSDAQWDEQSGDDNQFRADSPYGGGDQRWKTDDRIEQIYTDLSNTIFGYRVALNTGYAYDQSYHNGYGTWHAGLDMGASNGATIKAAIGGSVAWTSGSGDGFYFVGINSDDGR